LSKKVFITGGTGFLGSYIIKELVSKGYPVRALRRSIKLPFYIDAAVFAPVEWVEGDVLDVVALDEAMKGVDAVIHAAATVSFYKSERGEMYKVNVDGTANMVNIAIENNIGRFLHISSVAAIGRSNTGEEVTEEKKWQSSNINTHYANTKYGAEMEVWRGMGEGLNTVIVNPSTIIGYGDWNSSSCSLFKTVYKGFPWYSDGINGFVDVEDTARAIVLLMESSISGERFIINGDNWSFQKLFNSIADAFGTKRPWRKATPLLGQLAWRIEKLKSLFSGKKPPITHENAKVAHSKTYFSSRKIREALPGFTFTPLDQSIEKAGKKYLNPLQKL
jgi:dihydroflavonol-4-reductase